MSRSIRPTTLLGIKRLAKRIRNEQGIEHASALDQAARDAGFQNYRHARAQLDAHALNEKLPRVLDSGVVYRMLDGKLYPPSGSGKSVQPNTPHETRSVSTESLAFKIWRSRASASFDQNMAIPWRVPQDTIVDFFAKAVIDGGALSNENEVDENFDEDSDEKSVENVLEDLFSQGAQLVGGRIRIPVHVPTREQALALNGRPISKLDEQEIQTIEFFFVHLAAGRELGVSISVKEVDGESTLHVEAIDTSGVVQVPEPPFQK